MSNDSLHPHGQPLSAQDSRSANDTDFSATQAGRFHGKWLHLPVLAAVEDGQTPGYTSLEVTPELLARVNAMTTTCRQFSFCEISDYFGDSVWPDTDVGQPESEKLVADARNFYVQALTRAGEPIESQPIPAECLLEILNDKTGKQHWTGPELVDRALQDRTFRAQLREDGVIPGGEQDNGQADVWRGLLGSEAGKDDQADEGSNISGEDASDALAVSPPAAQPPARKWLYIEVSSTSGHGDSPSFVGLEVTDKLVERIEKLQDLTKLHQLSSVSDAMPRVHWGPKSRAAELRIQHSSMEVKEGLVWLVGAGAYGDSFESRLVEIARLRDIGDGNEAPWLQIQTADGPVEYWDSTTNSGRLMEQLVADGVVPPNNDDDDDGDGDEDMLQPWSSAPRQR
jgi:hypothetical protein